MELIGLLASLALSCMIICVLCYSLAAVVLCLIPLYAAICYPFERLRCLVAGTDDRFAPLGRLFAAALVSKLAAGLVVGAIALYLGGTFKTIAIAAALAFLCLG